MLAFVLPLGAQSIVGTIAGLKPETAALEIKRDSGEVVIATLTAETIAQRVAPGEKDLKKAEPIRVTDLAIGDRVLASIDPATNTVRRVVVMAAAEIAKRNEADRLDWQRRGAGGIVASKTRDRIVVRSRGFAGESQVTIVIDERTSFKRYAPDSVKFADARLSSIDEVSVGDQVRARGSKSEDGKTMTAEEVVFGTFLIKAGAVAAVNAASHEITLKELGTNKGLVVSLSPDSQLKLMPSFGGRGAGPMPPGMTGPPAGAMPTGGPGRAGAPDIAQMLEHLPPAHIEDLKPGQTVVVSSTKGAKSDRLTAITMLANADMLVQMAQAMSASRSNAGMGAMSPGAMSSGGVDLSGLGGLVLSGMAQ